MHTTPVFYLSRFNVRAADVETLTRNGTKYLKAPAILLRPMVLRYPNNRREKVPPEELKNSAPAWNGEPITVGHPRWKGKKVLANSPRILADYMVGRVFNAEFTDDALSADLFFNVARLEDHDRGGEIRETIESGGMGELSTGYLAPDTREQEGNFKGHYFNAVQGGIRPDHVAVLLDSKGKCSNEDGCGFPRTNARFNAYTGEQLREGFT